MSSDTLPKRTPSSVSQVLEARTGIAPGVRAAEARARVLLAVSACAEVGQRIRVGLTLEVDPTGDGDVPSRVVDIALVPASPPIEPLGDAIVIVVANEPSLAPERALAAILQRFGVRRFLVAIPTEERVVEWWPEMRDFAQYGADAILDRAFVRPIDVATLFDDRLVRELVARTLVDTDAWPVPLVREQAVLAERRESLRRLLRARSLDPSTQHLAIIEGCVDPGRLAVWIRAAMRVRTIDEVFAEPANPP